MEELLQIEDILINMNEVRKANHKKIKNFTNLLRGLSSKVPQEKRRKFENDLFYALVESE